jgi:hypothetical protein
MDKSKYYNKQINPDYYKPFEIVGNLVEGRSTKFLSKQEFLSGKNSIIYMDNNSNSFVFSDERNKKKYTKYGRTIHNCNI